MVLTQQHDLCVCVSLQTLNRMFIINAGCGFRLLWNTVKSFLDPKTTAKIHVKLPFSFQTSQLFSVSYWPHLKPLFMFINGRFLATNTKPNFQKSLTPSKNLITLDLETVALSSNMLFKTLSSHCLFSELPEFLGGKCTCADKGGCMRSDKGPWNDPEIFKVVLQN